MEKALYTEKQLSRLERDREIAATFKALRKKFPSSKLERFFVEIAKDYGVTSAAIRAICKKQGVC